MMNYRGAFREAMTIYPILAVLFGTERLPQFLEADCQCAAIANVDLHSLAGVIRTIHRHRKLAVVNLDAIPGLSRDRGGLEYLASIGVRAIASSHGALMPRIRQQGCLALQKVFITDRSNLPRISAMVRETQADVLQLQPAPVLSYLTVQERQAFGKFVAAGFVRDTADVDGALAFGAQAVATRSISLWSNYQRQHHQ